jgi:hypothetical protein
MEGPISPPPVKGGAGDDLPAYMSNGVVGLKIRDSPPPGMALLSRFSGNIERKIEAAAYAPYPPPATSAWEERMSGAPQSVRVDDQTTISPSLN